VFTLLVTVGGGITERLLDRPEFPTISKGLWFALQTETTVGYGDVAPTRVDGRIIAAVVMLAGIGFIAVITASVTAGLVESSRRRFAEFERDLARRLEEVRDEVRELLVRIETGINQQQPKA
jgi:voltage-gated potassium channel